MPISSTPEYPESIRAPASIGCPLGQVRTLAGSPEEYYQSNHQGIFIGGDFVGDIVVYYDYENADMIARSFQGDIKVGQMLQGAVVAVGTDGSTDPLDGTIGSIEVGLPLHPYADGPNPSDEGGFQGTFKTTLDAPMNGPGVQEIWYGGAPGYLTERAKDSVIRAYTSIGSVRITKMSNGLVRTSGNPGLLRPRVEAPFVGSIVIDEMESGSVWSGTLIEFDPNVEGSFDNIEDNYATVGVLSIGCVGPAADLWLHGTPLIEVTSALAGEIHVPSLANGQTIRVGEQFLDVAGIESPIDPQSVPCGRFDGGWHSGQVFGYDHNAISYVGEGSYSNEEPTPRSVWDERFTDSFGFAFGYPLEPTPEQPNPPFAVETNTLPFDGVNRGVASYGRILIREPNGLRGQIIIDANNTGAERPGTHWLGDVEIGTGDAIDPNISVPPEVISTARATTIGDGSGEGPLYTALPSSFGNGAVGLVPFALHDRASHPDNPGVGDEVPGVILQSIFLQTFSDPTRPDRVRLEFYGPIVWTGSSLPVTITYPNPAGGTPIDATQQGWFAFAVANAPGTNSPRVLEIFKGPNASDNMPLDVFTVTPNANLVCDLGPGLQPVPVAPFTYRFRLVADCPSDNGAPNGIPDAEEIEAARDPVTGISSLDDGDPIGIADNGIIDACDRTSCPPCAADYDNDGGVTGGDLAAFFFEFEQGLTCADVDQNGGIDGGDIGFFFAVFEAGGCE